MAYGFIWKAGGDCGLFYLSAQSIPITFLHWRTLHQSFAYTCLAKSHCFIDKCFSGSRALEDGSVDSKWDLQGWRQLPVIISSWKQVEGWEIPGALSARTQAINWREQDLAALHRCLRVPLPQKWHQLCQRDTPTPTHKILKVTVN